MASVVVVMDDAAVDYMRGWLGDVGRSVLRLAKEARFRQQALVGKQHGFLAASITVGDRGRYARGIQTTIGANAGQMRGVKGYAYYNDQGALPHMIYPKNRSSGELVFFWPKVGQVVHLKSVSHPGNRAYKWVERGMEAAMSMWQRGG